MIHSNSFNFVTKQNNQIIITNNFNPDNNKGTICAYDKLNPQTPIGVIKYFVYYDNKIFMESIHVNEEFKKSGIGSALIYTLEHFAVSHNIKTIEAYMNNMVTSLDSLKDIKSRTEFYKALNFTINQETTQIYSLIKNSDKFFTNKNGTVINLTPIKSSTKK